MSPNPLLCGLFLLVKVMFIDRFKAIVLFGALSTRGFLLLPLARRISGTREEKSSGRGARQEKT